MHALEIATQDADQIDDGVLVLHEPAELGVIVNVGRNHVHRRADPQVLHALRPPRGHGDAMAGARETADDGAADKAAAANDEHAAHGRSSTMLSAPLRGGTVPMRALSDCGLPWKRAA